MPRTLLALLIAAMVGGSAAAEEVVAKATEAESLAGQGKFVEAMAALDDAAGTLWAQSPLTFRRGLWVAESPNGFGAYNPRETNVYAAGDEMIVYAEPVGFGWSKSGDIWRTDLVSDLTVKSKSGELLLSRESFQKLEVASRVRNREFMATFTYTLNSIPDGDYVIETTLRDNVTGKSATLALPFTIR